MINAGYSKDGGGVKAFQHTEWLYSPAWGRPLAEFKLHDWLDSRNPNKARQQIMIRISQVMWSISSVTR
jgi:hypothetical protein